MIKLRFISLAALALAIGSTTSEARPRDQEVAEARARIAATVTPRQYMRLDDSIQPRCTELIDSGENRFDRMYDRVGGQACQQGR